MWRRLLALFIALIPAHGVYAAPRVAVSIAPVHSLVQAVMDGVGQAHLVLGSNQSPHSGSLSPSAVRAVVSADLMVWVGPQLEGALSKLVGQVSPDRKITLLRFPEMELLSVRLKRVARGSDFEEHHDHNHEQGELGEQGNIDPHIWLSTANASSIVVIVTRWLMEHDAANASRYKMNSMQVLDEIARFRQHALEELETVKQLKYATFHDAYQYFEHDFEFSSSSSVSMNVENTPGAKHLRELIQHFQEDGVRCIFSEPQFSSDAVEILTENSNVRVGVLDPLGANLAPGKQLWFQLMGNLVMELTNCLEAS
ncbi:MAG: zinc ABC transporter substrate-binding protein [bacterium]